MLEAKVGEWTVQSVTATSSLTFTNAGGVGGGVSAGTYRIKPRLARGGTLTIEGNQIQGFSAIGIHTVCCVAPRLAGNTFSSLETNIRDDGSVSARITGNTEVQVGSNNARISLIGSAWPVVHDNFITNGAIAGGNLTSEGAATRSDMGINVDTSGMAVDHPLLGVRGKVKAIASRAENVFAYGADLVDGDTFAYNGTIYTFKTSSPSGNQFNAAAGLIALLHARASEDCADYGADFSPAVVTNHIRIKGAATATVDANYLDTINALNATALVIPRNDSGGGESIQYSRGEGAAGPTADKLTIWSLQTAYAGGVHLMAAEATGAVLVAGGVYTSKAAKNGGCCEVLKTVATQAGTEVLRWSLV